jgi:hypothetical protein
MPLNMRFIDRRKFMWDGEVYDSQAAADARQAEYKAHEFEVQTIQEEGKFLLYTRRVVKNVVVEGEPPPA